MMVSHLLNAWIVHMSHYTLSALILSKSALTSSHHRLVKVLIYIDIGGCCCYIMLLLMIDVHVRVVVLDIERQLLLMTGLILRNQLGACQLYAKPLALLLNLFLLLDSLYFFLKVVLLLLD
jgi:hypothetical protein